MSRLLIDVKHPHVVIIAPPHTDNCWVVREVVSKHGDCFRQVSAWQTMANH
jgi:hypothetical protein